MSGHASPLRSPPISQDTAHLTFEHVDGAASLKEKLATANGRPTLVYFTADWCVICRGIERDILSAPEIVTGLKGFQRVKVDLTTLDEAKQDLMRDLAVIGPPTVVFFDASGAELNGSRLIGDMTVETLAASIVN
ncbi:hypothetical protein GCM10011491_12200 [Brucella endophytica]|uniref:Thioredoxin domain-containing protein n=1 Tax=Brucella endophytica TaxID=1963359 RepID=A0A916WBQ2_9HYPH|nr:thioredoxin fold domain-containing protein [Brucella endophytica]GGA86151.1 hypothetical protein GCM10011491_12200 [Brucella endophytica]